MLVRDATETDQITVLNAQKIMSAQQVASALRKRPMIDIGIKRLHDMPLILAFALLRALSSARISFLHQLSGWSWPFILE